METLECIKNRRSIRRFTDKPVSEETLMELFEAVRFAPSWANTQCWELIVVKSEERKAALAQLLGERNPARKAMLEAPVVVVFCGRRRVSGYSKGQHSTNKGDWFMFDLGIAAQNFCLAAHALGLGTVHIGSFDHKAADELLGLPNGLESVEIIPLGHPAKSPRAVSRKNLDEFIYLEQYGDKYL